ncbi:MAG: signal peptide peptidase SppA [Deltaproteobacteria bacterium]|nr:signal peptide peptidase SppA [Deltaproteobacteria bacterium]
MPGKRHPILMVVILLGITVLLLGGVMALVLSFLDPTTAFSLGDKIGVIPIEGPITDSEPVVSQLVKYKKDKQIRAIILRVDSPGGGVAPSQEIYREVRKTIETKRVIVSMGNLAASGGYYIAAAADRIVANPGTLTGSIGVIMEFVHLEDLLGKIGVNLEVLKSGEFKDIGSPHRKMTEREKELLRDLISEIQKQFVEAVAAGRNLDVDKVRELADGRILSGSRAKDLGLVDALGNFQDAVELAKKLAGIEGEATLVFPKKPRLPLWELIFQDAGEAFYRALIKSLTNRMEYR